jgi:Fur family ferric uptake transcriptional regulator
VTAKARSEADISPHIHAGEDIAGHPHHAHTHDADASERWAEHATASVRRAGHRAGGARQAVIESLADQECCRSAQEIFDQLRADNRRVGIASVYRVLDLLVSLGLVQRLDLGGGVSRFEPALPGGEHHHHLVCVGCGDVLPFENPALEAALEDAAHRSDFTVEGHDVVLRGRCPRCRAA